MINYTPEQTGWYPEDDETEEEDTSTYEDAPTSEQEAQRDDENYRDTVEWLRGSVIVQE